MAPTMRRLRWLGTGLWAVVDQALFAGSNFVLNLILARWMGATEYGVFSLIYSVFILVSMAVTTLILDPMLMYGAKRNAGLRSYFKRLAVLLGALLVAICVLLGVAALIARHYFVGEPSLPSGLMAIALVGPCILLMWTLRRTFYVIGKPSTAAVGGGIYLITLLGALVLTLRSVEIDAAVAILLMAPASLLASAYLFWRFRDNLHTVAGDDRTTIGTSVVFREHWEYGRWLLASSGLNWVAGDTVYLFLTPGHGFDAVGSFKAALNLLLPVNHALAAMSSISIPWLVRTLRRGGTRRHILLWVTAMTALGVGYSLVLVLFGERLIALAYGSTFDHVTPVVYLLAILPVVNACQLSVGSLLRSMERTREVFVASAASAAAMVSVGLLLTLRYGTVGAALSLILTGLVYLGVMAWLLWQVRAGVALTVQAPPTAASARGDLDATSR